MMSVGIKFVSKDEDVAMLAWVMLAASEADRKLIQDQSSEKAGVIAYFYSRIEPDTCTRLLRYGSTFHSKVTRYVPPMQEG